MLCQSPRRVGSKATFFKTSVQRHELQVRDKNSRLVSMLPSLTCANGGRGTVMEDAVWGSTDLARLAGWYGTAQSRMNTGALSS